MFEFHKKYLEKWDRVNMDTINDTQIKEHNILPIIISILGPVLIDCICLL